jgi:ubiquinone/menaquinone biosynthesis C-methylase UbiE
LPRIRRIMFRWVGVAPDDRVRDAGCGTGDTTRLLAEMVGPSGTVIGVDTDATSLDEASARIVADGLRLGRAR